MKVSISLESAEALGAIMEGVSEVILPAAAKGLDNGLGRVAGDARELAPFDTGALKDSIHAQASIDGDTIKGTVKASIKYAVCVEMGTGPNGEAHHEGVAPVGVTYHPDGWVYHDESGFHYTRGQPARPFLYPAYKANEDAVLEDVRAAIRAAMGG